MILQQVHIILYLRHFNWTCSVFVTFSSTLDLDYFSPCQEIQIISVFMSCFIYILSLSIATFNVSASVGSLSNMHPHISQLHIEMCSNPPPLQLKSDTFFICSQIEWLMEQRIGGQQRQRGPCPPVPRQDKCHLNSNAPYASAPCLEMKLEMTVWLVYLMLWPKHACE